MEHKSIDYRYYRMELREYVYYGIPYSLIVLLTAYVFYRSIIAAIIMLPSTWILLRHRQQQLCNKRKQQLRLEFKEAVTAVSSGLSAGYSIENAFIEAGRDMELLYGSKGLITQELMQIRYHMSMNRTLESCLADLADRSDVEDIQEFAAVFTAAKRNSGSLVSIISNAVRIINDKIEIQREIETLISARQLEQRIMNIIPFFIILYVGSTGGGLLDVLYHNIVGIIIMTVCLLIYITAIIVSEKIVDIQV